MGKKKKKSKDFEEDEEDEDDDDGCCPDTHAKCFELVLIVGFLIGIAALTVNLILNLFFFKLSTLLLVFTIVPAALNLISIIVSIILRTWRSDNSVFKKNFSSSSSAACFLLVLILINFLSTIAEDVLFYFAYKNLTLSEELIDCLNRSNSNCDLDDLTKKIADIEKMNKIIMDKVKDDVGYGIDGEELEKKMDMLKLLPWAAFNVNLFIQLLSIIMDCILMGRINLKSHFGFPKEEKSKSSKNKMIDMYEKKNAKKKGKKKKRANGLEDLESDITIIKDKKTKNKKKKKKKKKTTRKKLN